MNKPRLTHRISRAALILVFALFSATTAWASVITLNSNTGEVTLQNGDVLTGTGGTNTHVKIADGATVTLYGVNITAISNDNSHQWAGITCLGNAVIVLAEGTTNDVKGEKAILASMYPQTRPSPSKAAAHSTPLAITRLQASAAAANPLAATLPSAAAPSTP